VIPAAREAEARRIAVRGQHRQIVLETHPQNNQSDAPSSNPGPTEEPSGARPWWKVAEALPQGPHFNVTSVNAVSQEGPFLRFWGEDVSISGFTS
jgi:hypothetical protein